MNIVFICEHISMNFNKPWVVTAKPIIRHLEFNSKIPRLSDTDKYLLTKSYQLIMKSNKIMQTSISFRFAWFIQCKPIKKSETLLLGAQQNLEQYGIPENIHTSPTKGICSKTPCTPLEITIKLHTSQIQGRWNGWIFTPVFLSPLLFFFLVPQILK